MSEQAGFSGLKDKYGIPIYEGDVLKVFHFIGARREQFFMFKVVGRIINNYFAYDCGELIRFGKDKAHKYRLDYKSVSGCLNETEIVQGYGPGDIVNYKDRIRAQFTKTIPEEVKK